MQRTSWWISTALSVVVATVSLLFIACGESGAVGDSPPFKPVASVEDLMHDVVYPNAEVVWDSVGTIITEEGTNEIRPRSHEEWEAVFQSALTVAETGNLLMMEGRAKDAGTWMEAAVGLIDATQLALQAAEANDPAALFDAGGEIYVACTFCHEHYWEKPPSAMRP